MESHDANHTATERSKAGEAEEPRAEAQDEEPQSKEQKPFLAEEQTALDAAESDVTEDQDGPEGRWSDDGAVGHLTPNLYLDQGPSEGCSDCEEHRDEEQTGTAIRAQSPGEADIKTSQDKSSAGQEEGISATTRAARAEDSASSDGSIEELVLKFGDEITESLADDFKEEGVRDLWASFAATVAKERTLDVKGPDRQAHVEKADATRPRSSTWSWEKPGSDATGGELAASGPVGNYWAGAGISRYPFMPNVYDVEEAVFEGSGGADPGLSCHQPASSANRKRDSDDEAADLTPLASPVTTYGGEGHNNPVTDNIEDEGSPIGQAPETCARNILDMNDSDADMVEDFFEALPSMDNGQQHDWAEEAHVPMVASEEELGSLHSLDTTLDEFFPDMLEEAFLDIPEDAPSEAAEEEETSAPKKAGPMWWLGWLSPSSMFSPIVSPPTDYEQAHPEQEQPGQTELPKFSICQMWQRFLEYFGTGHRKSPPREEKAAEEKLIGDEPVETNQAEQPTEEGLHALPQGEPGKPPAPERGPPSLPRVIVMDQVNAWLDLVNLLDTMVEEGQDWCVTGYQKVRHMTDPGCMAERATRATRVRRVAFNSRLSAYILVMHIVVMMNAYTFASLQQERHVWATANRTTRRYLLERIHRYGGGGQPLWLKLDLAWGLDLGEVGAKGMSLLRDGMNVLMRGL